MDKNLKSNIDAAIESLRSLEGPTNLGFVKKVLDVFLADTPRLISMGLENLAKGDLTTVARNAHSLKSTLATMGMEDAGNLAAQIEGKLNEGKTDGVREDFENLKTQFDAVIPYLSQIN